MGRYKLSAKVIAALFGGLLGGMVSVKSWLIFFNSNLYKLGYELLLPNVILSVVVIFLFILSFELAADDPKDMTF